MYNYLYDTPLDLVTSTPIFHGCERAPGMGRSFIVTPNGVFYGAYVCGEGAVRVVKSLDQGFTWTTLKLLENPDYAGVTGTYGGVCVSLFWSARRDSLFMLYGNAGVITVWDVTHWTSFGNVAGISLMHNRFAAVGDIDRKIGVCWADSATGVLYFGGIDIGHYVAGVRDMSYAGLVLSCTDVVASAPTIGIYDISELADGFCVFGVKTATNVTNSYTIGRTNNGEALGLSGGVGFGTPDTGKEFVEIFGIGTAVLQSQRTSATPTAGGKLYLRIDGSTTYDVTPTYGLAKDGDNKLFAWPQAVNCGSYVQIFYMTRNSGDTKNVVGTRSVKLSDGTLGAEKTVTGSITSDFATRDRQYAVFQPTAIVGVEKDGVGCLKVAVGNGDAWGWGHRSGDAFIYIENLFNNAYPLTIAATAASAKVQNHYTGGAAGAITERVKGIFEQRGMPGVVLKYELGTNPEMSNMLSYTAPTEMTGYFFIDEISLKNPSNVQVFDGESFNHVIEKDIRLVFMPPDFYLGRTYKRTRNGFVKRTVYLFLFYGRYYELTQVVPVFHQGSLVAWKANAYACGPSYDAFTRFVLPNET